MSDVTRDGRRRPLPWYLRAVVLAVIWAEASAAQRPDGGFGSSADIPLGFTPAGMAVMQSGPGKPAEIMLLSDDQRRAHGYLVSDDGILLDTRIRVLPDRCTRAVECNLTGGPKPDLVFLGAGGTRIFILPDKGKRTQTVTLPPGVRPTEVCAADLDRDGKDDLLLVGKTMAGVAVLYGRKEGPPAPPDIFFPDISVGAVVTTDLNGDGIADLILSNWLSSRIMMSFGLDGRHFGDPVELQLPSEASAIAFAAPRAGADGILAAALPDINAVRIYSVRGTGAVTLSSTLTTEDRPLAVRLCDLNGDRRTDVVAAGESTVSTYTATSSGTFRPPLHYGVSARDGVWDVVDVDGDRRPDLVVAERASRRLVAAANSAHTGPVRWGGSILTSPSPAALRFVDVTGDGASELCVAGDGYLTILGANGRTRFMPGLSVRIPAGVTGIASVAHSRPAVLATVHAGEDRMTVVHVRGWGATTDVSEFSVCSGATPLLGLSDTAGRPVLILRCADERKGTGALSSVSRLGNGRYVEQPIGLSPSGLSRVIAAGHISRVVSVAAASLSADSTGIFHGFLAVGSMSATLTRIGAVPGRARALSVGDMNGDGLPDIAVVSDVAGPQVGVLFGTGNQGTFRMSRVPDVRPREGMPIIVEDVNGDGCDDLVLCDDARGAVVAIRGLRNGSFEPPLPVARAEGATAFAVGSAGGGSARDLAVAYGGRSTVTVYYDPFTP